MFEETGNLPKRFYLDGQSTVKSFCMNHYTTSYQNLDESELFEKLKNNDELAFAEVYRRFEKFLSFTAHQLLGDSELVKDVLQDFFVDLWANKRYLKIKGSFRGYAYRAIRNNCIILIKRGKFQQQSIIRSAMHEETMVEQELVEENNSFDHLKEKIPQLLMSITAQQRQIVELYIMKGIRRKQAAIMMGISENTAKTHLAIALKSLRLKMVSMAGLLLAILLNYYF